jgi:gp16 family phage-associated protein
MSTKTRTRAEARQWLADHGVTQTEFARRIGVDRLVVVNLLGGKLHGRWGAAHKAAIALGLKPAPKGQNPLNLARAAGRKR